MFGVIKQAQQTKYTSTWYKFSHICLLEMWLQISRLNPEEGDHCVRNDSTVQRQRYGYATVAALLCQLQPAGVPGPIELTEAGTQD